MSNPNSLTWRPARDLEPGDTIPGSGVIASRISEVSRLRFRFTDGSVSEPYTAFESVLIIPVSKSHDEKVAEARDMQHARVEADTANHRSRVEWLSAPSPCWACGARVSAADRSTLLRQSRDYLAAAGAPPADRETP